MQNIKVKYVDLESDRPGFEYGTKKYYMTLNKVFNPSKWILWSSIQILPVRDAAPISWVDQNVGGWQLQVCLWELLSADCSCSLQGYISSLGAACLQWLFFFFIFCYSLCYYNSLHFYPIYPPLPILPSSFSQAITTLLISLMCGI